MRCPLSSSDRTDSASLPCTDDNPKVRLSFAVIRFRTISQSLIPRLRCVQSQEGQVRSRRPGGRKAALQTLCNTRHSMHLRIPTEKERTAKPVSLAHLFVIPCEITCQSSYLRRLQEAAAASAGQASQSDAHNIAVTPVSPTSTLQSSVSPRIGPAASTSRTMGSSPYHPDTGIPPAGLAMPSSGYPVRKDPSPTRYPHTASLPSPPYPCTHCSEAGSNVAHASHPSPLKEEEEASSTSSNMYESPMYIFSVDQQETPPIHPPTAVPSLTSHARPRRLEEIAGRDIVFLIINLFFDYVYPLTPCIHKPSFMADLNNRREERDALFFALVTSTMASTLVQVPRSYLPMERPYVRKLAKDFHEASRLITIASYDPPTSMHVVIRYL